MSSKQKIDFSQLVDEEFNYSSVSKNLPNLVKHTDKIIKLTDEDSTCFYACSEKVLIQLIQNSISSTPPVPSFFDGMKSFASGEAINLAALNQLEPRAPEYDKDALDALLALKKRK